METTKEVSKVDQVRRLMNKTGWSRTTLVVKSGVSRGALDKLLQSHNVKHPALDHIIDTMQKAITESNSQRINQTA